MKANFTFALNPLANPRCLSCWCSWWPSPRIFRASRRRPCHNMSQYESVSTIMALPQNGGVPKLFLLSASDKVKHPNPTFI